MTESEAKTDKTGWDYVRVILGVANVLTSGFFALMVGSLFLQSMKSVPLLLVEIVVFLGLIAQLIAGIGLIPKKRWVGTLMLVAVAVQVVALSVAMGITKSAWVFVPAIPSLVTLGLLTFPKFDVPLSIRGKDLGLRPMHAGLVAGGLAVVYLVSVEAGHVAKQLELMKYEAACEDTGEPTDCRQAAMFALRLADDYDEMREIEKRFEPLCEKGNAPACRSIGYARSDYFSNLGPPREVVMATLRNVAMDACLEGDGRGCAVAFWFSADDRDAALPKAKELCDGGDLDACLVWVPLAVERGSSNEPSPSEEFGGACEAGVKAFCDDEVDARTRCLQGELDACAAAESDPAGVLAALGEAHRRVGNPGLYGFAPPAGDYVADCEAGNSMACLVAGIELLGPSTEPSSTIPPLPNAAALDATLGRACDDGIAVACLAYGFRLLDRGVDEERDIGRANSWLRKGCDLGSEPACRHVSFEAEMRRHEFDGYRKLLQRACTNTADRYDCTAYVSMLAFDIGATPWPISDDIAYVHLRHACEHTRDAMACANAAYFVHGLPVTPEFQQTALSLGHIACRQSYVEGCQTLLWSAERWWPGRGEKLRKVVCEAVPAACR